MEVLNKRTINALLYKHIINMAINIAYFFSSDLINGMHIQIWNTNRLKYEIIIHLFIITYH